MNKTIKFSGITRNIPQDSTPDGSCQEIIGMRYRKGAFRPIGAKKEYGSAVFLYDNLPITFDAIYLHDIEGGPIWIGYKASTTSLYQINKATGVCQLIYAYVTSNISVRVVFLKMTMIVTTSEGLLVFLYSAPSVGFFGIYSKVGSLPTPQVDLTATIFIDPALNVSGAHKAIATAYSAFAHEPTAVLGNYYAVVNQQSALGRLYGSIMYIVAFRLFDGTYVMHSVPRYLELSNGGILRQTNPNGDGWNNAQWAWVMKMASVSGSLNASSLSAYSNMRDLVDSVVVFATKCTPLSKVDDTTVLEKLLQAENYTGYDQDWVDRQFSAIFPLNSPDFEDLAKSSGWYRLMEFDFSDAVDTGGVITKEADSKNYYQDYAVRKALTTDQFSHHGLIAKSAYVYNDRVHILNVKTKFETPVINWLDYTGYTKNGTIEAVIAVHISSSLGKVVLTNETTIPVYLNTSTGQSYLAQPAILGYPDSRATKIEVAVKVAGLYKLLYSVGLLKNEALNSAYYHRTMFAVIPPSADYNYSVKWITLASLSTAYALPTASASTYDTNRLQASEIQNPLVFPAKNSYQIGTGEGLAMASGSEPLSAGQFGAFPLQVFTSKGRYALQQGSGDILYASVQNIDGEVIDNPLNVISMGSGVIYSTEKGLFVGIGQQVSKLSESVEGQPHSLFNALAEIQTLLTDTKYTPTLQGSLSDIDFLDYLHNSSVAYDQLNKEIIVTNPAKGYSYIYSVENKIWFKIAQSFSLLINSYPTVLGISGSMIYDLSDDDYNINTPVMIISNASNLEMSDVYKKVERMIVRAWNSTAPEKYLGVYLFGSDDLLTYQILSGKQKTGIGLKDLIIQRSHGSCKYYIVVYNGVITHDSTLSNVDILFTERLNKKLR